MATYPYLVNSLCTWNLSKIRVPGFASDLVTLCHGLVERVYSDGFPRFKWFRECHDFDLDGDIRCIGRNSDALGSQHWEVAGLFCRGPAAPLPLHRKTGDERALVPDKNRTGPEVTRSWGVWHQRTDRANDLQA